MSASKRDQLNRDKVESLVEEAKEALRDALMYANRIVDQHLREKCLREIQELEV